jgi:HEAT repeat protein
MVNIEQKIFQFYSELHDSDPVIRKRVSIQLQNLDKDGLRVLIEHLQSSLGDVRCDASTLLCIVDAQKYMPFILPLLTDPLDYVRWHIAGLLHDNVDERAIAPLIDRLLQDPDSGVRYNACWALCAIGDARAIPALNHASLHDSGTDYEGRTIRDLAAEAVCEIINRGSKSAQPSD